ncbi:hypothetical protein EGW08_014259, partial [Elysia chlorotica]
MTDLKKLLQSNESFKSDLMRTVLTSRSANQPRTSSDGANLNLSSPTTTTTTTTTTTSSSLRSGNINLNAPASDNGNVPAERPFYVDPRANSLADVNSVLNQMKESSLEQHRLLLDQITDAATEAHMTSTLNTRANIREADARIARQHQGGTANQMPDMSKLSISPDAMMQHFLNSMVPEMTKVVQFSKQLPGFGDVSTADQLTLIKQGIFEVMIARITLLIDPLTDSMIDPSLSMKSPRPMVRKMSPLGPFIDQFFEIAKLTKPLDLTDGENGLFGAILMLCPDRHGLQNVSAVQTIQHTTTKVCTLAQAQPQRYADELFCNLMSSIAAIRKINDEHFRLVSNMKNKCPAEFECHFPQLHRELFDTS